ncbi:MAG: type 4a pilus biogenesis protein PilO [Gammaproteobacteria bacterium]|nr:type 4a pilus biogenesis protein PilO [Gammaproteobacteria bacterium]
MALSELRDLDFSEIGAWPSWLKISGIGAICVAILFAGYWFIVKDQLENLSRVEKEEQKLRQTYLSKKALAINLQAYRDQMKEMEETFGVMLQQLPDKTEVPELLIDITQTGLGRGLQFELFKPQKTRQADFYAELPINLRVTGSFHQLGEFVSDLAALPRIVTIGDIKLTPVKDQNRLRMEAVTKTYHYLDEEQIASQQQAAAQQKKKQRRRR